MVGGAKTRRLDGGVDRLSNLPTNLIDIVLDFLPIHDAARTSILSKTWRNIWEMHPNLAFEDDFFLQVHSKNNGEVQQSEVSKAISNVLLAHKGPILNFYLFVPKDQEPLHPDMDLWIKNISNNGVREFELDNDAPIAYKLPSYLFSCVKLTHLSLTHCILNPPHGFRGFCNLIVVELEDVTINADMSFGLQLTTLELRSCTGIEHLGCHFKYYNNLTELIINACTEIDLGWFECTKKLEGLVLLLDGVSNPRNRFVNLDNLIGNMPEIQTLHFDAFLLEFLEPGSAILKRPITTKKNLNRLFLYGVGVGLYDLSHIQYIIYFLRSSPNLQYLYLRMNGEVKSKDGMDLAASSNITVSSVVQYLQPPNLIDMIYGQLQNVNIEGMVGSRAELQFIKFLLASSPLLRRIELSNTMIDDPEEKWRVSKELMSFPRASKSAQIIWT